MAVVNISGARTTSDHRFSPQPLTVSFIERMMGLSARLATS